MTPWVIDVILCFLRPRTARKHHWWIADSITHMTETMSVRWWQCYLIQRDWQKPESRLTRSRSLWQTSISRVLFLKIMTMAFTWLRRPPALSRVSRPLLTSLFLDDWKASCYRQFPILKTSALLNATAFTICEWMQQLQPICALIILYKYISPNNALCTLQHVFHATFSLWRGLMSHAIDV